MPGFTIMPINRAPCSTPSLMASGGFIVPGKAIENIIDPTPIAQVHITPNGGAGGDVLVQFKMPAAPSSSGPGGDPDLAVDGIYLGNHNLDGCSFDLRGYTGGAPAFASGTSVGVWTLDTYSGFANMLRTFTSNSYEYWFLRIYGATPGTVKIGVVALGPTFDLGYPAQGAPRASSPFPGSAPTMKGFDLPTRVEGPQVTASPVFENKGKLGGTVVYNRTKSGNSVAYNTLKRAFESEYSISLASGAGTRVGVNAGGGYPVPYHEGDAIGISAAGRPAQLAFMSATFGLLTARDKSTVTLAIRDVLPRGAEIQPATN